MRIVSEGEPAHTTINHLTYGQPFKFWTHWKSPDEEKNGKLFMVMYIDSNHLRGGDIAVVNLETGRVSFTKRDSLVVPVIAHIVVEDASCSPQGG
jgi:hypothetical protein